MFERKRIGWNDLQRVRSLLEDALVSLRDLESRQGALETAWEDVQLQVRRAYQRVEAAERRQVARDGQEAAGETDRPAEPPLDPWARKVAAIRETGGRL